MCPDFIPVNGDWFKAGRSWHSLVCANSGKGKSLLMKQPWRLEYLSQVTRMNNQLAIRLLGWTPGSLDGNSIWLDCQGCPVIRQFNDRDYVLTPAPAVLFAPWHLQCFTPIDNACRFPFASYIEQELIKRQISINVVGGVAQAISGDKSVLVSRDTAPGANDVPQIQSIMTADYLQGAAILSLLTLLDESGDSK